MFIIAGTKEKKKKVGWVAEVCVFCRDIKPFRFIEVRSVAHLYYISLGAGKVKEHEIECRSCQQTWSAKLGDFDAVLKTVPQNIKTLIEQTNPEALDELQEWLESQERCQNGEGTPQERQEMIFMAIMAINPRVLQKVMTLGLDRRDVISLLQMILLPIPLLYMGLSGSMSSGWSQAMIWSGIAIGVISLGFLMRSMSGRFSRFIRKELSGHLIDSLILFEPTRAELNIAHKKLIGQDFRVGKHLRMDWLYEDLLVAGMPEPPLTQDTL